MARKRERTPKRESPFKPLGGKSRRYELLRDAGTWRKGQTISNRAYREFTTGMKLGEAKRVKAAPSPSNHALRQTVKRLLDAGFKPAEVSHRSRTFMWGTVGQSVSFKEASRGAPTRNILTTQQISGIAKRGTVVSESRAAEALDALTMPHIGLQAEVLTSQGGFEIVELVGEKSTRRYYDYFNAIKRFIKTGSSDRLDSLKGSALRLRIFRDGRVQTITMSKDKALIRQYADYIMSEDFTLPDSEALRGGTPT